MQSNISQPGGENGQTIILVAISLISLLAMAALAIDVVTLYVARGEIQRAADAAALAGAKAIADSGVTTLQPSDPNIDEAKVLAQSMASSAITAVIGANPPINLVAGAPPTLVYSPTVAYNSPNNNNPRITVALQRTNLPTFFARIWGRRTATVTASATAEAYNPANTSSYTPIALKGVKPWLVANADPFHGGNGFVVPSTGAIEPGVTVVGEPKFDLILNCDNDDGCDTGDLIRKTPPYSTASPPAVYYLPALVDYNNASICPSCLGTSDYERCIECYDANPYGSLSCGGAAAANAPWEWRAGKDTVNNRTVLGTDCLIHAAESGLGEGQDILIPASPPFSGPMQIRAQSGPENGNLVTTSSSIVTIPLFDTRGTLDSSHAVRIVGFLQAFVNQVKANGNVNITVLNVAGCSDTPNAANPIVGGSGTSPIPVRLITPP